MTLLSGTSKHCHSVGANFIMCVAGHAKKRMLSSLVACHATSEESVMPSYGLLQFTPHITPLSSMQAYNRLITSFIIMSCQLDISFIFFSSFFSCYLTLPLPDMLECSPLLDYMQFHFQVDLERWHTLCVSTTLT